MARSVSVRFNPIQRRQKTVVNSIDWLLAPSGDETKSYPRQIRAREVEHQNWKPDCFCRGEKGNILLRVSRKLARGDSAKAGARSESKIW
jgi:hypothetical protein